jgi:hypothetical protein
MVGHRHERRAQAHTAKREGGEGGFSAAHSKVPLNWTNLPP